AWAGGHGWSLGNPRPPGRAGRSWSGIDELAGRPPGPVMPGRGERPVGHPQDAQCVQRDHLVRTTPAPHRRVSSLTPITVLVTGNSAFGPAQRIPPEH